MFTLKDFLLAEQDGRDPVDAMQQSQMPDERMQRQQQQDQQREPEDRDGMDQVVSLTTDIRKIMQSLSMVNINDAAEDPRSFTFLDLIEALNTTEEVIRDRLSSEGATLNDGRQVAANGKEWQNDEKNDFTRLFHSIGEQVKDTIRTMFTVHRGDGDTSVLPRFVHSFNTLIVDRLMDALKVMGPQEATGALGGIIDAAKQAVVNMEQRVGDGTSASNMQTLNKYRQARKQTIGKKHANQRTPRDRIALIKRVASDVNT